MKICKFFFGVSPFSGISVPSSNRPCFERQIPQDEVLYKCRLLRAGDPTLTLVELLSDTVLFLNLHFLKEIYATFGKSPRREVVRSSAGAGVIYPPFWGSFA